MLNATRLAQKQIILIYSTRGCAGGRIDTRFLRPRGTCPLKGANPAGTPGYRNGSFFGLKGRRVHPVFYWGSCCSLDFHVMFCRSLFDASDNNNKINATGLETRKSDE
jgi:hypothetical protein